MVNEVKISGKIYNAKEAHTPSGKVITTFGLSVWNGKKDGQNTYEFINCKFWDSLKDKEGEKIIRGKLTFDTWEKDGKKVVKPVITVEIIRKGDNAYTQTNQDRKEKQADNFLNDDIHF